MEASRVPFLNWVSFQAHNSGKVSVKMVAHGQVIGFNLKRLKFSIFVTQDQASFYLWENEGRGKTPRIYQ